MKILSKYVNIFDEILFGYATTKLQNRQKSVLIFLLYLLGIIYWLYFFNFGNIDLSAYDWVKEAVYLDTLRNAISDGVIPWSWNEAYYHSSPKFLANPEFILTPDIFLLPFISNSSFVIIHLLLFYTIGFISSLILLKKLQVNFISLFLFWMVFNFNGYITSHIAVGHYQWTGYFILPFFFTILIIWATKSDERTNLNIKLSLLMALLLGFLILNGSLHIAIWCCMFMVITFLLRWKNYIFIITSVLVAILLGLERLLPGAIWFQIQKGDSFLTGYPGLIEIIDALTNFHRHDHLSVKLGWWNYNLFIGWFAFILLTIGFIYTVIHKRIIQSLPLLLTSVIFILFSVDSIYEFLIPNNLPFSDIERVPSRFIIMSFLMFLIFSLKGIDLFFSISPKISRAIIVIAIPLIALELLFHSFYWRIKYLENSFKVINRPSIWLVPNSDSIYSSIVLMSWFCSSIIFIVTVVVFLRNLKPFIIFFKGIILFDDKAK